MNVHNGQPCFTRSTGLTTFRLGSLCSGFAPLANPGHGFGCCEPLEARWPITIDSVKRHEKSYIKQYGSCLCKNLEEIWDRLCSLVPTVLLLSIDMCFLFVLFILWYPVLPERYFDKSWLYHVSRPEELHGIVCQRCPWKVRARLCTFWWSLVQEKELLRILRKMNYMQFVVKNVTIWKLYLLWYYIICYCLKYFIKRAWLWSPVQLPKSYCVEIKWLLDSDALHEGETHCAMLIPEKHIEIKGHSK